MKKIKIAGIIAGVLIVLVLFTAISWRSTSPAVLRPKAYAAYVEDPGNGLRQEKLIGQMQYTLQYQPQDYLVVMNEKDPELSRGAYDKAKKELQGLQYCTLKLEATDGNTDPLKSGIGSEDEYFERLQYLTFDAQKDFYMLEGSDTMPCRLYHFERMYEIAPYNEVVLAFDTHEPYRGSRTFIFNDRVFGSGPVQFRISEKDLKHLPSLKLK